MEWIKFFSKAREVLRTARASVERILGDQWDAGEEWLNLLPAEQQAFENLRQLFQQDRPCQNANCYLLQTKSEKAQT